MKRMALVLGLSCMLLAINGCGTAVSDLKLNHSTAAMRAQSRETLFPAQVGYTWQYDTVLDYTDPTLPEEPSAPGTYTAVIQAVKQVDGKTVLELKEEDSYIIPNRFPVIELDEQSITLRNVTFLGPLSDAAEGHTIDFLHLPLQAGAKWDDGQWIAKVKGEETVSVPAGTYKAWKIEVIGTYNQAYTTVGDYWIAPGAGIVKSDLALEGYHVESVLASAGTKRK